MKKLTLLTTTLSLLAICLIMPLSVQAQGAKKSASSHKIGLIDMAHIFKSYDKFTDLRKGLKGDIEASDKKAKEMAAQIQSIQKKLQSGTLKNESPEYVRYEKRLVELTSEFEGFRKNLQREFLRKEAKIYKEIYLEVSDAVALYAKHYDYTLVLRFNRLGVADGKGAKDILQKMNRQVVFYQENIDITQTILDYMNGRYKKMASKGGTARQ